VDAFEPLPLLGGSHRQTLAGFVVRRGLRWTAPATDVVVDAPDDVRLLVRVTWQNGARGGHPALVLVHGLEGWDGSSYMVATAQHALAQGWHVVRMNLRGCGDSERLCPRLYNAGLTSDLLAVLQWAATSVSRFAVCGFSLGGNLALLTAALHRESLPAALRAIVAVSPPLDLALCAEALERRSNILYRTYFLRKLESSYARRQALLPDLYSPALLRSYRSIREFDDAITAPYGGYRDVADYYARASAGPRLRELGRPALILAAADDPLIPAEAVMRWPTGASVTRETPRTGGHVGFVGRSQAPGYFWAAERAIDFARRETT